MLAPVISAQRACKRVSSSSSNAQAPVILGCDNGALRMRRGISSGREEYILP